ncbi:MAG: aldo/keto reductase [Kiloniellales bacterium]
MRTVKLPSGTLMPAFGLGTWGMGEDSRRRAEEAAALRYGLDLGLTLIDTAEMYAEGGAEEVVGEAIKGRRDEAFIVSKVYPHNAGRANAVKACERSLKRLGTDCIDLYLLHWRGLVPLAETFEAFNALRHAGKIRDFGVSNFDRSDMIRTKQHDSGLVAVNQVYYNLARRGIEWDLLPWCGENGIPVMAYSPLDQGRLLDRPALRRVAARHQVPTTQVALAWLVGKEGVVPIPKSSNKDRVREFFHAQHLSLTRQDLDELEVAFPPPSGPSPLEMT